MLFALVASGCAPADSTSGQAAAIVGSWRYQEPQAGASQTDPSLCGTDFGASYHEDGRFVGYDEAGEWRIEHGRLVEIIWEPEISSGLTPRATKPEVRRFQLEWKSPDVVNLRDQAGQTSSLIRCSKEP